MDGCPLSCKQGGGGHHQGRTVTLRRAEAADGGAVDATGETGWPHEGMLRKPACGVEGATWMLPERPAPHAAVVLVHPLRGGVDRADGERSGRGSGAAAGQRTNQTAGDRWSSGRSGSGGGRSEPDRQPVTRQPAPNAPRRPGSFWMLQRPGREPGRDSGGHGTARAYPGRLVPAGADRRQRAWRRALPLTGPAGAGRRQRARRPALPLTGPAGADRRQ